MVTSIGDIQQEYPNNGFWSYLQQLKDQSKSNKTFWKYVDAFFTLIWRVIKDAGIEITFLLIFWLIITKMSQGRDLIVSLFEPDNIYSSWRIFYTVASAFSLSLSMWIIPAFIFQYRDNLNKKKDLRFYSTNVQKTYTVKRDEYVSVFKRHMFFAHRVLPLVPFWLLACVLFNEPGMNWLFIVMSFWQLFLLYWFHKKMTDRTFRWLWFIFVIILLIAAIVHFSNSFEETYNDAKIAMTAILYLFAFLLHFIYHESDLRMIRNNENSEKKQKPSILRYPVNSFAYILIFCIHAGITFALFQDSDLPLAPESMMLYIFSLYVFIIDLVVYLMNLTQQIKLIGFIALIILFAIYKWNDNVNFNLTHYTLDNYPHLKNGDSTILGKDGRWSFEQRYELLRDKIRSNHTGQPYPIILVSGEGGGSRAGYWLSQNLINFDYYTRGKFREHIFSMSTVSGSSVGVGAVMTFWEMTKGQTEIDSAWLNLPLRVFANNFVGSSVKGMLLTDPWKSIIPFGTHETDRNSLLQKEESYYTQLAADSIMTKNGPGDKPKIPIEKRLLCNDFMDFFYDTSNGKLRMKDKPLVLINTCRSNDGRRGIVSPVKLTDSVFNDAIDIAGFIYEDSTCKHKKTCKHKIKDHCATHKRPITLGQATNLSELFPGFSAPAYVDSLGSFVDGGYHENSGLKTTLDVYTSLLEALKRDSLLDDCEIYILYFKNGPGEKNLYNHIDSDLPIKLPLKALTSQPFEGSASYFEEKAEVANGKRFFSIRLNNEIIKDSSDTTSLSRGKSRIIEEQILKDLLTEPTDTTLQFPLARWLSKSVIKRMRLATFPVKVNPNDDDFRINCLLQRINSFHDIKHADLEPFRRLSPNANRIIAGMKTLCDFIDQKTADANNDMYEKQEKTRTDIKH